IFGTTAATLDEHILTTIELVRYAATIDRAEALLTAPAEVVRVSGPHDHAKGTKRTTIHFTTKSNGGPRVIETEHLAGEHAGRVRVWAITGPPGVPSFHTFSDEWLDDPTGAEVDDAVLRALVAIARGR